MCGRRGGRLCRLSAAPPWRVWCRHPGLTPPFRAAAIVTGDTPEDVYERLKQVIREQGTNRIWVPSHETL